MVPTFLVPSGCRVCEVPSLRSAEFAKCRVCKVLKCPVPADDTKVLRKVKTPADARGLQDDLDRLYRWSDDWQMLFNIDKCKCLHFGHRNIKHNYSIGDSIIQTVSEERDLGVIIHQSLNASTHCAKAVKSVINRTITNKDKTTIIRLYKELVRPHRLLCTGVEASSSKGH